MKFHPEYVAGVLNPIFVDFREGFREDLLDIHYAHLLMLYRTGILDRKRAAGILAALDRVSARDLGKAEFDGRDEDFFFYVERLLQEDCGEELAGHLHTARSRNDMDLTLYRMRSRRELGAVADALCLLRRSLLDLAGRELNTLIPLYTHGQAAQPSTVAHYFAACLEHLARDFRRLRRGLLAMNLCPMGSCAITGTGFPIDRDLVADLLAFDGHAGNTYGGIAGADYILEGLSAVQILLIQLGRVVQDLLLWSTNELRYVRWGEGFVQVSSIMPQKRNPVVLEHCRALASRAGGGVQTAFQMLHNTPFGDIVDAEDDFQPVVSGTFRDTATVLRLLASAVPTAVFDREGLAVKSARHGTTLTELADTLVREQGISFRQAHRICARMAAAGEGADLAGTFQAACQEDLGRSLPYDVDRLREVLSPRHFVECRKTPGGPSPEVVQFDLASLSAQLVRDADWLSDRLRPWRDCSRRLRTEVRGALLRESERMPLGKEGSQ